jgi:hypothetical protein
MMVSVDEPHERGNKCAAIQALGRIICMSRTPKIEILSFSAACGDKSWAPTEARADWPIILEEVI